MVLLNRLRAFFRRMVHRDDVESDLAVELASYYETLIERYMAQGMSEQEARRQVRLRFQHTEQIKEQVRDTMTGAAIESMLRDVRYALRAIQKAPAFALVTIVTLGLGIGANSTIFSIVSRFVLQSPPVRHPETLIALHTTHDGNRCCNNFSWPLFVDLREQTRSFSGVAAYYELVPASINGAVDPERVWGQAATVSFFDVAQLPMTLGRGFRKEEDASNVVVLGHGLWQRRFHADPNIAGKTIRLSGHPFTVVGIAPPSFRGLDFILDCQFWVPFGMLDQLLPGTTNRASRSFHWVDVVARLRPGVTSAQAAAELKLLAERFAKAHPESEKGGGFRLEEAGSVPPRDKGAIELFLTAIALVALLVLCIACANVANLALAQASGRQREMAVRLALGATRWHLLRQMLIESVLLALAGGVGGVALSLWATHGLRAFQIPAPVPLDLSVTVDWRVLLYTFAISAGAGILFGLAPAWLVARPAIASALKGVDVLGGPGRLWSLRNVLVVSQIGMSLVLLCSTSLFLRSLQNASRIDIGFRSRGVLMMAIDPRLHGYTPERTVQFLTLLRQKVAALPGVMSVACADGLPLAGGFRSDGFAVEGHDQHLSTEQSIVELYMATPGFFETLGIPLRMGRGIGNESAANPRVAVVNEAFAQRFFAPHENPLGQRVSSGGRTYQIVGVAGNIKSRTVGEDVRPVLFRALAQDIAVDPSFSGYSVVVHFRGNSGETSEAVRREIHTLDPSLAIFNSKTIEEHLRNAFFLPRLGGALFGVFGFIGLALASTGLYGLMTYWVSQRTREIGIRLALGAQAQRVRRLVLRQGLVLVLFALPPGLAAALAMTRLFAHVLYGVPPHDAITFTFVPLFLAGVACLACWFPSRRAAAVEPLVALRSE